MADTETTRQLVNQFWAAMQANDWAAAAALFADDYVLHWPQSGERIRGASNFVAINRAYPAAGCWHFTVERLVVEGEQAITDVVVSDGVTTARAITFGVNTGIGAPAKSPPFRVTIASSPTASAAASCTASSKSARELACAATSTEPSTGAM